MKAQRDNVVAGDFLVAQIFDKASWRRVYGVAGAPVKWAARYTQAFFGAIPRLQTVLGTKGPIGGWLCWLGIAPRIAAQWGQAFACQITSTSPVQATAVLDATSGTAVLDTTLQPMNVFMVDGTTPSLNDFVMVIAGTDLTGQRAVAFKGGGGSSLIAFKITSAVGAGIYNAVQVDPVTQAVVGGGISTARCQEMNLSTYVGDGTFVYCQKETSGGNDYYVFLLPMGPCTP